MAKDSKPRKARVLSDFWNGERTVKHGEVIELDDDALKAHAGLVDPHPDAVEHAEAQLAKAEAAKKAAAK